jgi:hypothetical protein
MEELIETLYTQTSEQITLQNPSEEDGTDEIFAKDHWSEMQELNREPE